MVKSTDTVTANVKSTIQRQLYINELETVIDYIVIVIHVYSNNINNLNDKECNQMNYNDAE